MQILFVKFFAVNKNLQSFSKQNVRKKLQKSFFLKFSKKKSENFTKKNRKLYKKNIFTKISKKLKKKTENFHKINNYHS